jgi:hypothetical protein
MYSEAWWRIFQITTLECRAIARTAWCSQAGVRCCGICEDTVFGANRRLSCLTLPSERISLGSAGLEIDSSRSGRRGGGSLEMGLIDFPNNPVEHYLRA